MSTWRLWWDSFVQSWKYLSLKLTRELCVMRMKNDAKIEEELTSQFKIGMSNLTNFDSSTQKSQKFHSMAKYITFDLKKYNGVIFDSTEYWCKIWRKADLWFQKMTWGLWEIFTNDLKVSKSGLWRDSFKSKVENIWA